MATCTSENHINAAPSNGRKPRIAKLQKVTDSINKGANYLPGAAATYNAGSVSPTRAANSGANRSNSTTAAVSIYKKTAGPRARKP